MGTHGTLGSRAPTPPVILFGRAPDYQAAPTVMAVRADGTALAPSVHPSVRTDQVFGRRKVWSKILHSESQRFSGCGFAGCSSGYNTSTEAGIAAAQFDGIGEHQLTEGGYDTAPAYGPDGTLAFLRHHGVEGYPATNSIAFMDARGRIVDTLEPAPGFAYESFAWSPDGTSIAAHRVSTNTPPDVAGAAGVFILGRTQHSERLLVAGNFRELAWSPDGARLVAVRMAYMQYGTRRAYEPGDHHRGDDLWVLPLDGSAPTQITHFAPPAKEPGSAIFCNGSGTGIPQLRQPMWSPDGSQIAFLSNNDHLDTFGRTFDVAVAGADGTGAAIAYAVPEDTCVPVDSYQSQQHTVEVATLYGWAAANIATAQPSKAT